MARFKYDVAISFAGEDRMVAEKCARLLSEAGYEVFYDLWEQYSLWGKNLYQHLDMIYRYNARYCLVLVSESYKKKAWATHELRSAQARAFEDEAEYILPVRIDDAELPGLPPTVGYLDLRRIRIEEVVATLIEKLGPVTNWHAIENDLISSDPDARIFAITRIALEGVARYLDQLIATLGTDSEPEVRARAAWALDNLNDATAMRALIQALSDSDWNVRSNAGWALVHLGEVVADDVREVAAENPNPDAREMAILILNRITTSSTH